MVVNQKKHPTFGCNFTPTSEEYVHLEYSLTAVRITTVLGHAKSPIISTCIVNDGSHTSACLNRTIVQTLPVQATFVQWGRRNPPLKGRWKTHRLHYLEIPRSASLLVWINGVMVNAILKKKFPRNGSLLLRDSSVIHLSYRMEFTECFFIRRIS
jgi:hypothetical protein